MAANDIATPEPINASKERFDAQAALELAQNAQHLWAAKGKKQVKLKIAEAEEEEMTKAMIGPSGNLRAPSFRVGRRFVVGFQEDLYREIFGL